MARVLKIQFTGTDTDSKQKTKTQTFKNPKSGLSASVANAFITAANSVGLYDGISGLSVKRSYYSETIETDLT